MTARVVDGWSVNGIGALILENAALRVVVLPELGGHVLEIVDKVADRNLLWSNPRTLPRRAPYAANFDDWWSGGWDEIFPTGDRAQLHDEPLPYMGELWSVPWTATFGADEGRAWIETTGLGTIAPARFQRTIELSGDEPVLRVRYRLTNLDNRTLPFLWGIHPCLAVTPAHRIDLPAEAMFVGVSSGPAMGEVGATYTWPGQPDPAAPTGRRDVRRILPPSAAVYGGHWATDLREGWLALTDSSSGRGVALVFPREVFPCAWLWQVYGGWRGHHHVCLEPWTGYPMELQGALAAGRARTLEPGESLDAETAFVLYGGLEGVTSVERESGRFVVR